MAEYNINNITRNLSGLTKQLSEFENTKAVYDAYVKKISKSDFANSITRYQMELKMLGSMKEIAEKTNMTKELKYVEEKIKVAEEKLADLGIKNK